ncbi:hypothetical protein OHV05_37735 (plasmid) [Kitasatospora sp. NBC_00070]|uniref:hypothetical protein n=1 Tax=Kitasatospora sp. NBC_00070 TaxID=2975962 RepID=UPI00324A3C50
MPREPRRRGLPESMDIHIPLAQTVFGDRWALAGWTVQPNVLLVLGAGQQVGWVERGLGGLQDWVAVYEGYFLGDAATQEAALHATPQEAARTVHQAHLEGF